MPFVYPAACRCLPYKDGENTVADDESFNENVTGIKTPAGSVIINRERAARAVWVAEGSEAVWSCWGG